MGVRRRAGRRQAAAEGGGGDARAVPRFISRVAVAVARRAALRPPRHRQDDARQGCRHRVRHHLLQRVVVHRGVQVEGRQRKAGAGAIRTSEFSRSVHRVHRRDRRFDVRAGRRRRRRR